MKKQSSSCLTGCLIAFFSLCLIVGLISTVILKSVSITPQSVSIELRNLSIDIPTVTLVATSSDIISTPIASSGTTTELPPTLNSGDLKNSETFQVLHNTIVPSWDSQDLAWRFKGITHLSFPNNLPPTVYELGDQETFYASNDDDNGNFRVNATLRYKSAHLYFWIENGTDYNAENLNAMGDEFEKTIYPTDRKYFGSEWTPGIDNDVHLYVLYAKNLGKYVAGYFSSADELPPEMDPFSNTHEMFYMQTGEPLGTDYSYGVMAHEFQHMIQWFQDKNEEEWVNEGLSDLAIYLNGYDVGGFDFYYALNPDIPMTNWPADMADTDPYYGSAYLFMQYFYERFGENAIHSLVTETDNGMDGIDRVLQNMNSVDSIRGRVITADDVFADWTVANYLQKPNLLDGRYGYHSIAESWQMQPAETVDSCLSTNLQGSVNQYGVDYIDIKCRGSLTVDFQGTKNVSVVAADAHSGTHFYWSNRVNDSDARLTHHFDFSQVTGKIEMSFWTWYDLEDQYDFVYLSVSKDGSQWKVLSPAPCTESKNLFGCGYTGTSGAWIQQNIDLSQYAGEQVDLRFDYVTDTANLKDGFLIDDVSIPAISYSTDFETDNGGWIPEGFARIENTLPQTYQLTVIYPGYNAQVEEIMVDANGKAIFPLDITATRESAVLVISATARITQQKANYSISFSQK
jgi:immune inhibitor A